MKTLELQATPEEVMRAVETMQEFGMLAGVPGDVLFGLALALEECGSNIVNHALQQDPKGKFRVSLEHTGSAMIVELRDPGPEFDPTLEADMPLEADDDLPPGGWGIHLVRRYTDDIRYSRCDGENVLRLTKHLAAENG